MNNPPAFPGVEGSSGNGNSVPLISPQGDTTWINYQPGMTLRDWFAGMALRQRLTPSWDETGFVERDIKIVVQECYSIADAMLAAREKNPS